MTKENQNNTNRTLLQQALKLVKIPVILAMILTPVRYSLELFGLPENAIFLIGLLWLTLGVSIYWAVRHYNKPNFFLLLLLSLIIFSPISRIPVAAAWWIDNHWQLGTHYGLYFDNFAQVLLNQLFYGSLVQIIPGFAIGAIVCIIMRHKYPLSVKNKTLNNG